MCGPVSALCCLLCQAKCKAANVVAELTFFPPEPAFYTFIPIPNEITDQASPSAASTVAPQAPLPTYKLALDQQIMDPSLVRSLQSVTISCLMLPTKTTMSWYQVGNKTHDIALSIFNRKTADQSISSTPKKVIIYSHGNAADLGMVSFNSFQINSIQALASLRFASLRFASLRFASFRFASLRFAQ